VLGGKALRQPAEDCCEHGNENHQFGTGLPAHDRVTPQVEAADFLWLVNQCYKIIMDKTPTHALFFSTLY